MRNAELIRDTLKNATAITWDTCHKIYLLMDDKQVEEMRGYGYEPIIDVDDVTGCMAILKSWYESACGLRFIEAIATDPETGEDVFTSLIGQGW